MKSMKKTEKLNGKQSGKEKNQETAVATTGRVHSIAKARPTPVAGAPKEKPVAVIVSSEERPEAAKAPTKTPKTAKHSATDATPPQPDDSQEVCVFAFRLTRGERDELHAATGSAKASRFVKAIVLAGARRDMKAVQEIVEEIHASNR